MKDNIDNSNFGKDLRDLYKKFQENSAKTQKFIAENTCNKLKDIGDRVMVWDRSFNEDLESGEHYSGITDIFQHSTILIQKNCKNIYTGLLGHGINRDIIVYSPKYKRKIATCIGFVKLIE